MRRWWIAAAASLAFFLLLDLLAEHGEHWWAKIPAFFSAYGLIGCIAIILFAKVVGKLGLQRAENYYEREAGHD